MRRLTDGLAGVVARPPSYRLEVWKTSAPERKGTAADGDYVYLTKINHAGEIGDRSIGIPASDVPELMAILAKVTPTKGTA